MKKTYQAPIVEILCLTLNAALSADVVSNNPDWNPDWGDVDSKYTDGGI